MKLFFKMNNLQIIFFKNILCMFLGYIIKNNN